MNEIVGVKKKPSRSGVQVKFRCSEEVFDRLEKAKGITGLTTQQICLDALVSALDREVSQPRLTYDEWMQRMTDSIKKHPEAYQQELVAQFKFQQEVLVQSGEWMLRLSKEDPERFKEIFRQIGRIPVIADSMEEAAWLLMAQAFVQLVPKETFNSVFTITRELLELFRLSRRKSDSEITNGE